LKVFLERLPAIAGAADEDVSRLGAPQLALQHLDGIRFHIDEMAPGLNVGMETEHVTSVAVDAGMGATGIAVERVVADAAFVEDRLAGSIAEGQPRQLRQRRRRPGHRFGEPQQHIVVIGTGV